MDERRRAERLAIRIPIELRNGSGITRDVSGLGVYFTAPFPLEPGEQAEFHLRIPGSVDIRCTGHVVRSVFDREAMSYGIAVTIDSYHAADEQGDSREAEIVLQELRRHHAG